jgi:hypothetical protein
MGTCPLVVSAGSGVGYLSRGAGTERVLLGFNYPPRRRTTEVRALSFLQQFTLIDSDNDERLWEHGDGHDG